MSNIIDKIQLSGVTYDIGGQGGSGVSVVEVTQDEYDALPSSAKTDTSKMYVITDAEAGDLTNYYTKTETNTLLGGKQDTLVSGTNIKTINNESLLGSGNIDIQGGGGKAVSAGTNISITTGETADTINCTLPMSTDSVKKIVVDSNYSSLVTSNAVFTADSLSNSILLGNNTFNIKGIIKGKINNNLIIGSNNTSQLTNGTSPTLEGNLVVGSNNKINSSYSLSVGNNNIISRGYQFAIGYYQKPSNEYEISLGAYNVSSSGSSTFGDSGNTLFSVGNGTSSSARHNAFEIRQNGDIYLSSGGTDIKLQDHLGGGGGGGVNVVQTTGTSTADVMSQDAVTTQLNGKADKATAARGITYGSKKTHSVIELTSQTGQIISGYYYTLSLSKINGKDIVTQGDVNPNTFSLVETSAITTSISSSSTDVQVPSAKAVYDQMGGLKIVKLTQSSYDALSPNYDSNTLYVIVN